MRLLKLRSNKDSFHTVPFNESGLSLIVGRKSEDDDSEDRKKTYNSVGKSLTISLVHFCLASNKNPEFEEKLKDWTFYLDFKMGEELFTSSRNCSNQNKITLNEKEYSLQEFRDYLEPKVFNLPEPIKNLKFRPLISRFIRPDKAAYVDYDKSVPKEADYANLICNSFLLGLDHLLVQTKAQLKDEIDDIDARQKDFDSDPILKSFFEEEDNIDIDILDLEQNVKLLENKVREFQVAEDYHEIVKEANRLKRDIKEQENKALRIGNVLSNIEKSLQIQPDISRTKIESFYKQAKVDLPESIIKRLDEVQNFNEKLLDNRGRRLYKEKQEFQKKLNSVNDYIATLGRKKDQALQYLNTKGALDEYTKLNEQLRDKSAKLNKLKDFKKLRNEYRNKLEELNKQFSDQNIETNNYLENQQEIIKKAMLLFKGYANLFYEKKKAGIDIKNNDGKNKKRFNIKAKIDDDRGDGVNDIKIFCFDWTLLRGRNNHSVDFVFHDSRLLSEIDPRQVATLFETANVESTRHNLQYIITANENTLVDIKSYFSEEVYSEIIDENIILELTDESSESKLLGIQIDLDYTKE